MKFTVFGQKDQVAEKLRVTYQDSDDVKSDKLKIYALLLSFKYHQQKNIIKSDYDLANLDLILEKINDVIRENDKLNLTLNDCLLFVKNDGFIVKRKITGHFKQLLLDLTGHRLKMLNVAIEKLNDKDAELTQSLKQFFSENVGLQLDGPITQNNEEPRTEKVSRRTFLAECYQQAATENQKNWYAYMNREILNCIVVHATKNQLSPQSVMDALGSLHFSTYLKELEKAPGQPFTNFGFTDYAIDRAGQRETFDKAKANERNNKNYGVDTENMRTVRIECEKQVLMPEFIAALNGLRHTRTRKFAN